MKKNGRIATAVAATLVCVGTQAFTSTSAKADDSWCHSSYPYASFCTFWGQNYDGAHDGYGNGDVYDLNTHRYPNNGAGSGQIEGNNNGSNRNYNTQCPVMIYYNPGYTGYSLKFGPYGTTGYQRAGTQLGSLLNNIRSIKWTISGPCY